jgi:hypothetical protein
VNAHLTSTQISEWIIGQPSPEAERHVSQCAECAGKVARLQISLGLFREAVQETPVTAAVWNAPPRRPPWAFPLRSIAVTFAVLLLVIVPVYREKQLKSRQAEMLKQDAALLSQVESELNESVPHPMAPLSKLVSYQSLKEGTK